MSDPGAAAVAAQTTTDRDVLAASTVVDRDVLATRRRNSINVLWEGVQALVAIALTAAVILVAAIQHREAPEILKSGWLLVLGFYFGRTNHSRPTPTRPYGDA